jgi:archaellum component FlaC
MQLNNIEEILKQDGLYRFINLLEFINSVITQVGVVEKEWKKATPEELSNLSNQVNHFLEWMEGELTQGAEFHPEKESIQKSIQQVQQNIARFESELEPLRKEKESKLSIFEKVKEPFLQLKKEVFQIDQETKDHQTNLDSWRNQVHFWSQTLEKNEIPFWENFFIECRNYFSFVDQKKDLIEQQKIHFEANSNLAKGMIQNKSEMEKVEKEISILLEKYDGLLENNLNIDEQHWTKIREKVQK